jgi:membrane protease YdiL (CAAX protease family)
LLVLITRLRTSRVFEYLGLTRPRARDLVLGVTAIFGYIVVTNSILALLGRNIVTPFQLDIYRTALEAGAVPWLFLAVIVVAPVAEEVLFRGFLFRGWHRSPRDAWIVIAATALLWAFVHLQYDAYTLVQVLVCGLLLGWIRWITGSTTLVMLLHGIANGEAMVETIIVFHG